MVSSSKKLNFLFAFSEREREINKSKFRAFGFDAKGWLVSLPL